MAETILLIDDDPAFGEELAAFLEGHGMICEAVAEPAAAIPRMADVKPDLMLLDQRLGATTGTEILR